MNTPISHPDGTTEGRRLVGKRALVTAAAQGIGEAIARRFAREGARVLATDLNADRLASLSGDGIDVLAFDAADPAAVAAAVDGHPTFDVLVNCVGWVHQGTILDVDHESWTRSFRLNVDPMYHAIRAVLPGMLAAGRGSIINISSAASSVMGFPNRAAYGASKAAVIGLTKSVAVDFVARGIRCNAICPGTVASPSLQDRINSFEDPVAAQAAFVARQPMGRLGTTDEIAALAAYMAADESAFMTAGAVILDGGATN